METHNIISTPQITGNIGSCTSQNVEVIGQRLSFWKQEKVSIVTNSCTGEVEHFTRWELTDPACGLIALGVVSVIIIVIMAFAASRINLDG